MRVLFFNPEQYVDFENEPSNVQLRLPILNCGLVTDHRDHVYQRDLRADGRVAMDAAALRVVAGTRPDVVVYSATWEHENLSPWVLRRIRDGGTPVVSMLWDSWIEPSTAEAELLAASTVLVVGDSLNTYHRCRLIGASLAPAVGVAFFGGQVFTDLLRPLPEEAKVHDVTLLGSNEGERAELVAFLEAELPRRGLGFNKAGGLVDSRKGGFALTDAWVPWDEYVRIINRSRLCLNARTDPTRQQIKGKIFDYMACGVACLTDENADTRRFLPEGVVARFDGKEDALNQIVRLLADDGELGRLAGAGYRWLMANFDYRSFWGGVLRAALGERAALPTSPMLEADHGRLLGRRDWTLRRDLSSAARLATLDATRPRAHRLAPLWSGRRHGLHKLTLEDGSGIACDRMPVEVLRDGWDIVLVGAAFDPVVLGREWIETSNGGHAVWVPDAALLDTVIDERRRNAAGGSSGAGPATGN